MKFFISMKSLIILMTGKFWSICHVVYFRRLNSCARNFPILDFNHQVLICLDISLPLSSLEEYLSWYNSCHMADVIAHLWTDTVTLDRREELGF